MNVSVPIESVTIIGAGITGLAAAWKVRQLSPRTQVTILESSGQIGGVLQTKRMDGYLVEAAADMFTCQPPTALALCQELGLGDQLLTTAEPKNKAFVGLGNKVVPVPAGFSLMVPTNEQAVQEWPLLSESGKQRLLAEVNVASRDYGSQATDEDFASFAIRRFGQEAFEVLIQPLVSGIYSADPCKLSMNATMQRFVEMEKEHGSLIAAMRSRSAKPESTSDARASGARYNLFRTPQNGFGSLVTALAEAMPDVEIKTDTEVQTFEFTNGAWNVTSDERSTTSDALIMATPAAVTARILSGDGETIDQLKHELASIKSTSCAIVAMGIKRSELPEDFDGFGIIYPHIDGGNLIAISFSSNKYSGRAPDDKLLLRFFIGGAMQETLVDLPDETLVDFSLDQFEKSLDCRPLPEFHEVYRWKKAMPQYHVGHLDRVARIESLVSQIPNFELAGKSYRGVGIPACIASGYAAAEQIFNL